MITHGSRGGDVPPLLPLYFVVQSGSGVMGSPSVACGDCSRCGRRAHGIAATAFIHAFALGGVKSGVYNPRLLWYNDASLIV